MPYEDSVQQDKKPLASKPPRGTLMMLATHIGRADDAPARSIQTLQTADLLIFEEDRPARAALKIAKVHREYLKFSEHQQKETLAALRCCLLEGKTAAYMSDQGCPTFSDPGAALLKLAYELGANVRVVPGPSSLTAALAACPFPLDTFFFAGFLPRTPPARAARLAVLAARPDALILMDAPYRLEALLRACAEAMGKRRGFLALDITGNEESYLTGTFASLLAQTSTLGKLNFVLIIAGHKGAAR